jgi:hypothetical protein
MVARRAWVSCMMVRAAVSHNLAHVSLPELAKMSRTQIVLDGERCPSGCQTPDMAGQCPDCPAVRLSDFPNLPIPNSNELPAL